MAARKRYVASRAGSGKRSSKTPERDNLEPRSWSARARFVYWSAVLGLWGALVLGVLIVYVVASVPDPSASIAGKRSPNITILAADGSVLAERGLRRSQVRLKELPPHLVHAVLATEDRRFYSHWGVDPWGLLRALWQNARAGEVVEGGSTITQQLAKNLFLSNQRTMRRKAQELVLAAWLEARFSKDKILELYLNRVYFGAGAYGVEDAARRYFGKSARQLTLPESALLIGLLKAPSRYAPTASPDKADGRASEVIANMVEAKLLSSPQAMAAISDPARPLAVAASTGFEYAVDWIAELLPAYIGERDADLIVETTIDARIQRMAATAIEQHMAKAGAALEASEAAVIVLDSQGAIRAIVGGRSYGKSQFNRAVKSLRQPGSAFKPFVYLAAIEAGMTPETLVQDAPITVNGWQPKNYKDEYKGAVTLRDGLADSINTVAVRLTIEVGRTRVMRTARRLGISSTMHDHPSIALGTAEVSLVELAAAYVPFANGGAAILPHAVLRVRQADGKTIYLRKRPAPERVVTLAHVGAMNEMLNSTLIEGTGTRAALPDRPAAGKTGTTQNFRDAWFIGYTANYVGGVWVGNDDGAPMKHVTGGSLPAAIWRTIMAEAHKGVAIADLPGTTSPALARSGGGGVQVSTPGRDETFLKKIFGLLGG